MHKNEPSWSMHTPRGEKLARLGEGEGRRARSREGGESRARSKE